MNNMDNGKHFIVDGNKMKFNMHSNFCGRKKCIHFSVCGQALRDIDKHKIIDKGYIPIVDTHGNITCYSEEEVEKSEGQLEVDNTPDWPAQMIEKGEE